ncbi:hypothetical protein V1511DRAFT_499890 [Dipodascopsis uninucleata]
MSRNSRLEKLRELSALKKSGKTRLNTYEVDENTIYDEVDEAGYTKVIRERLLNDDFVVDDDGLGYADTGVDDWDRRSEERYYYSEDEETERQSKRSKKSKNRVEASKQKNKLDKFLSKGAIVPKLVVNKKITTTKEEDQAFMEDLMEEIVLPSTNARNNQYNNTIITKAANHRSLKRSARRALVDIDTENGAHAVMNEVSADEDHAENVKSALPSSPQGMPDIQVESIKREYISDEEWNIEDSDEEDSESRTKRAITEELVKEENDDDDDIMVVERPQGMSMTSSTLVNLSSSRPESKRVKAELTTPDLSSEPNDPSHSWSSMNASIPVASSPVKEVPLGPTSVSLGDIEADGKVKFFWTDYCELNDRLILFGKTKLSKSNDYVSCMVQVSNIMRKLYFLPRQTRKHNGIQTDDIISMEDVREEVSQFFKKEKTEWMSKPCERKYAFDLPEVPHHSSYLMVLYPYKDKVLPSDMEGETYSRVFGTQTSLFEQFVLLRKVMGPCWLELKNPNNRSAANSSWCKVELAITNPDDISVLEDTDTPPLTMMSIALRTVLDSKTNKQEIVAISARIFTNIPHDTTESPENLRPHKFTIVRPFKQLFPAGFENKVKREGHTISLERSEQAVLSNFLARIQRFDPDVIVGHQLEAIDLNILMHRMKERNSPNWHRIGRLKRSAWPRLTGGQFTMFSERQVVAGRLLCDLANDMGKSVMMKCQSWSLTEMCSLVLEQARYETEAIDLTKHSNWIDDASGLWDYLMHCELDTHFIASLAIKTQLLPLTKQLTNIAGNSWARTLSGTRSERNEYILLHEFTKNKYIVPDKITVSNSSNRKHAFEDEDNEEDNTAVATKKKDKYKGGLVFEPEKGLYDKFVLVMDFNSLYPSIIQEFNICFTTVDRSQCSETDDTVPDPPPSDVAQGILPRLISTLVKRRKAVKNLMKDPNASHAEKVQWDIKQQALKLTANSMYGCLGYTKSRFYARPLAMLTTYKGREILMNTKDMAESLQLKVVYGDTDSVMINTNCDVYKDALNIGTEFKKKVNEQYRLLEIEIDNVFQRLLMHAKKKYAALNVVGLSEDGRVETQMEVKGLDMRRREYCALSKEASTFVLRQILSGDATENVVEKIHEYLRELADQIRSNSFPVQKFVIHTKLGKDPSQYPGGKTMPQVQVALKRMARGDKIMANDVMAYIIASGDDPNPAERALPPQDFKPDKELKPDPEWYLAKQILPPIERLCGPIEGTDVMHLANCLGLDTRKYQLHNNSDDGTSQGFELTPLESTIDDADRFRDARKLEVHCYECEKEFSFGGLLESTDNCTPKGIRCKNCFALLGIFTVVARLECQIREDITKYYDAWVICDDSSCGNRTRQISVYGRRCIGKDGRARSCRGVMKFEYSDKMLYNQLLYYDSIFNVDKAKGKGNLEIDALAEHNRMSFDIIRGVVRKYLSDCGRRYVDFHNIFDFM